MIPPNQSTLSAEQLRYWLALWRTPQIGSRRLLKLLTVFPQPEEIFQASNAQLSALGLSEIIIQALRQPDWVAVEHDLKWQQGRNRHIIIYTDKNYPPLLQQISAPPALLFVEGNIELLHGLQLAVVGSRNPSPSGADNARQFASYLAAGGLTIVSGLALGIDTAAHSGALAANGKTIAVLGSGLDQVYPHSNLTLAEKIIANGALVSEYPPDTAPQAKYFPQRNRIICGLSLGVLVVEATLRSGSLITARLAAEQGREVFAIPGSIHNPLARGCHYLIRQGAKLVETAQDIVEELGALGNFVAQQSPSSTSTSSVKLNTQQQQLLEFIGFEPTSIDQLMNRSGLSAQTIAALALTLELEGKICSVPGGYTRL